MRESHHGAGAEQIFSERKLLKRLFDLRRSLADADVETAAPAAHNDVRNRLLMLRMRDHEHCSAVERDLWAALYSFELDKSEQRLRKFEHSNFRRRIEAIGIINAAIENMIYFRSRHSSKFITVPLEEVILQHASFFGKHLCDLAQENISIRKLLDDLMQDPDDE